MSKPNPALPDTNLNTGLSSTQVQELTSKGEVNTIPSNTKTTSQILFSNLFTFFNLVNFVLGILVLFTGSYRNLLFLLVVVFNIVIGTVQEIRAQRVLNRLHLLSLKDVAVLRNSRIETIPEQQIVRGDVLVLHPGEQVPADCILEQGNLQIDQSLLTGESSPVVKRVSQQILSGSLVLQGQGKAIVNAVGANSFTGKLAAQAKTYKNQQSQIQRSINALIKVITLILVPIGILLFLKDYFLVHIPLSSSINSTVAALVAMIPQGLILLISMMFAIAVISLSKDHVLVQRMSSVSTLSRVNMLCLDKTGTITEPGFSLIGIKPLAGFDQKQVAQILADIYPELDDQLHMIKLLKKGFDSVSPSKDLKHIKTYPFSEQHDFTGVEIEVNGKRQSVMFGSAPFILKKNLSSIEKELVMYEKEGDYVELIAVSDDPFINGNPPENIRPAALVLYRNELRPSVPDALKFFIEQNIPIKIVSGDDPITASAAAHWAGIPGYQKTTSVIGMDAKQIADVMDKTVVFGNCVPKQKYEVVKALMDEGYTVGYFGNGVNDILALKQADLSGAVADGAQAACAVSDLVLMNSSFQPLPVIVKEGRKLINNLQRSGALYLAKTLFAILIAILYLFLSHRYPFEPIQYSLVSAITIGIPSFFLAFEPNSQLVHGSFLSNVLYRAIPAGLVMFLGVGAIGIIGQFMNLDAHDISTLSFYALSFAGFLLLIRLCLPFNAYRIILLVALLAVFFGTVIFFGDFFLIDKLSSMQEWWILGGVCVAELVLMLLFVWKPVNQFLLKVGLAVNKKLADLTKKVKI